MIKKIPTQQLIIGMFVCGNDRSWFHTPFFRSKFLITSEEQIQALQEYCHQVDIDTDKGLDIPNPPQTALSDTEDPATQVYLTSIRNLEATSAIKIDTRPGDINACQKIVLDLLDGLNHYTEALLRLSWQTGKLRDQASKPIDMCIQALATGKHLNFDNDQLLTLGSVTIQHGIAPGLPLANEIGSSSTSGKTPETSSQQALYRQQQFQAIARLTLAFNDLRQERFIDHALGGQMALQQMLNNPAQAFDADLLGYFVDTLELYPLDAVIELNTGEIGLVIELDQQSPRRPTISVLSNARKQLLEKPPTLRLTDASAAQYSVTRMLPPDDPIIELLSLHKAQLNS